MQINLDSFDPVNDKFGYYLVGNQKFHSKIKALTLATQTKQNVTWHWFDNTWKQVDWKNEPLTDIYELYRMRARQIRERYDYVIINYSGGSDSQTVVDAFLDSGCHIDEIVTIWNRKYTKLNNYSTDPRNIEAEFDLVTAPGLERIRQQSPTTKITYRDIGDSVIEVFNKADGESWVELTAEHLNPCYISRWSATTDRNQLITLDKGLSTVIVGGIDKPKICIKDDGQYYLYFVDILINSGRGYDNRLGYNNINYELFFWTPDFPEISVKQAHMIRQWFESNPLLKYLLTWPNLSLNNRTAYEKIIRSIIYPQYNFNTFQVDKVSSTVNTEWDHWFFNTQQESVAYHNWQSGVNWVKQNIDSKFLNCNFTGQIDGLGGFIQGHFAIQ